MSDIQHCLADDLIVRFRDSYKRFVKTWIRFANPWICTVLWITNPDFKRFVLYRGSRILTLKDSFRIVSHKSSHFQKIHFADSFRDAIFKRFDESDESDEYYESSRILSTIDLRIHTNPVLPDSWIPTVFKRFVLWIRFVDSIINYPYRNLDS